MSDLSIQANSSSNLVANNSGNNSSSEQTYNYKNANDSLYRSQFSTQEAYDSIKGSWSSGVKETVSMFKDWVFGKGEASRTYKPGSIQVDMIKDSVKVDQARNYFIEKNKNIPLEYQQSVTNYAAGFGLKGIFRAGKDPVEQYVGSYDIEINSNSDGTVRFKLENTTSMKSFAYRLLPSWERGTLKVGGNMRQTYTWVEQNPTIGLNGK